MLDELYGSCVFSKIDLKSVYHQVRIREGDKSKTIFKTKYSLYQWWLDAPSAFMILMSYFLRAFIGKFLFVGFADILNCSKNLYEHAKPLNLVFDVLRKEKLFAILKCVPLVYRYACIS